MQSWYQTTYPMRSDRYPWNLPQLQRTAANLPRLWDRSGSYQEGSGEENQRRPIPKSASSSGLPAGPAMQTDEACTICPLNLDTVYPTILGEFGWSLTGLRNEKLMSVYGHVRSKCLSFSHFSGLLYCKKLACIRLRYLSCAYVFCKLYRSLHSFGSSHVSYCCTYIYICNLYGTKKCICSFI